MLNQVIIMGKIPDHESFKYELKHGGTDKAFIQFMLSNRRSFKPAADEYYKDDLIPCKAFRQTADFTGKYFGKGDYIIVTGELRKDDDYEVEGQKRFGQYYVQVQKVDFPAKVDGEKATPAATAAPATAARSKPLAVRDIKPAVAAPRPALKRRSLITG